MDDQQIIDRLKIARFKAAMDNPQEGLYTNARGDSVQVERWVEACGHMPALVQTRGQDGQPGEVRFAEWRRLGYRPVLSDMFDGHAFRDQLERERSSGTAFGEELRRACLDGNAVHFLVLQAWRYRPTGIAGDDSNVPLDEVPHMLRTLETTLPGRMGDLIRVAAMYVRARMS